VPAKLYFELERLNRDDRLEAFEGASARSLAGSNGRFNRPMRCSSAAMKAVSGSWVNVWTSEGRRPGCNKGRSRDGHPHEGAHRKVVATWQPSVLTLHPIQAVHARRVGTANYKRILNTGDQLRKAIIRCEFKLLRLLLPQHHRLQ
jgi:hypothetical protein